MTFFAPELQIVSDLHLETPMTKPQYSHTNLKVTGTALFLLGDIGLVRHDGLFVFRRNLLDQNRGCRIFYVLGNHEAYQTTLESAVEQMRNFEEISRQDYGGRFRLLFRDRYDLNEKVTILGCTLWSNIRPHQATEVHSRMTDYNQERGIQDWTPERSCTEHTRDVKWLNAQVDHIQTTEPHRSIIVTTHHCPTIDARATDPRHESRTMNSGFVSDLSKEVSWISPAVKVWAFGHTHYSCSFRDDATDKLVVSNQKGYSGIASSGGSRRRIKTVAVKQRGDMWQVVEDVQLPRQPEEETIDQVESCTTSTIEETKDGKGLPAEHDRPEGHLLHQATKRVQAVLQNAHWK